MHRIGVMPDSRTGRSQLQRPRRVLDTARRDLSQRQARIDMLSTKTGFHAFLLAIALAVLEPATVFAEPAVTLVHVHGLSYSADGRQLLIPSHHGLTVFSDGAGRRRRTAHALHGFLGHARCALQQRSSGPALRIVESVRTDQAHDGGKTWQKARAGRRVGFHSMATSHGTNAV